MRSPRRQRLPGRRGLHACAEPGRGAAVAVRVTADDLPAAFASLPAAWAVLPGWTAALRSDVIRRVRLASGNRPIAPDDPFRALRFGGPEAVKVVDPRPGPVPEAGPRRRTGVLGGARQAGLAAPCLPGSCRGPAGFWPPATWHLDHWARQGVLLLNPTLTIEVGRIGSHMAAVGKRLHLRLSMSCAGTIARRCSCCGATRRSASSIRRARRAAPCSR